VSREVLAPLEPELEALLQSERLASPPADALDRVWTRLAVSVASGSPGGGHPGEGAAAAPPSRGWLGAHARAAVIAAFVGGGAVGAALVTALRPLPAERIVYVDRRVPETGAPAQRSLPRIAEPVTEAKDLPSSSEEPKPEPVAPPAARRTAAPSASASLAAERVVLDEARSALSEGDASRALALTETHAQRFAHPQLGEEREALAIQALVSGGRYYNARARAARFRATWPSSLFLPAVEASVASIP